MNPLARAEKVLRTQALSYPGVTEEFPWGHRALKVKGKAFAFLTYEHHALSMSVKLPVSNAEALMMPFAEPTHYGLGKSGWVTSTFGESDDIPLEILGGWLEESYRAIAPKRLSADLGEGAPGAPRAAHRTSKPGASTPSRKPGGKTASRPKARSASATRTPSGRPPRR